MRLSTILKNTIIRCNNKNHIFKICKIIFDTMSLIKKNTTRTILIDEDALCVIKHICSFGFDYGIKEHFDIIFAAVCMLTWENPRCIKEFKNTIYYQYLIIYFPITCDDIDMFGIGALTISYLDNTDLIDQYFYEISINESKFSKEAFKRILKRTRYVVVRRNKTILKLPITTQLLVEQPDLLGDWRLTLLPPHSPVIITGPVPSIIDPVPSIIVPSKTEPSQLKLIPSQVKLVHVPSHIPKITEPLYDNKKT